MKTNDYVIINNRAYDPVTGLPVDEVEVAQDPIEQTPAPIQQSPKIARGVSTPIVHQKLQHSTTLSRRYVKRPGQVAPAAAKQPETVSVINFTPMSLESLTAQKAPAVQKFAAQPVTPVVRADRPAQTHPVAMRASGRAIDIAPSAHRQRIASTQKLDTQAKLTTPRVETSSPKPAQVLKNEAIHQALSKEIETPKRHRAKRRQSNRWGRFLTFASSSLAIIALAGYFTYLNMPNLSIKMAAIQSGINAKYPGYQPDGYALNGPITYRDGEVSMRFAYASGDRYFDIKQERSSWDSSAVKEFVATKSQDSTTTTVDGLTIYTYGNNATWVNGGVLYTLKGDAPLSSSQVSRIATSM